MLSIPGTIRKLIPHTRKGICVYVTLGLRYGNQKGKHDKENKQPTAGLSPLLQDSHMPHAVHSITIQHRGRGPLQSSPRGVANSTGGICHVVSTRGRRTGICTMAGDVGIPFGAAGEGESAPDEPNISR